MRLCCSRVFARRHWNDIFTHAFSVNFTLFSLNLTANETNTPLFFALIYTLEGNKNKFVNYYRNAFTLYVCGRPKNGKRRNRFQFLSLKILIAKLEHWLRDEKKIIIRAQLILTLLAKRGKKSKTATVLYRGRGDLSTKDYAVYERSIEYKVGEYKITERNGSLVKFIYLVKKKLLERKLQFRHINSFGNGNITGIVTGVTLECHKKIFSYNFYLFTYSNFYFIYLRIVFILNFLKFFFTVMRSYYYSVSTYRKKPRI